MFVARDKIRRHLLDEYDRSNSAGTLVGGTSLCGTAACSTPDPQSTVTAGVKSTTRRSRTEDACNDNNDQLDGNEDVLHSNSVVNTDNDMRNAKAKTTTAAVREPAYWNQHLENIREMRSKRDAPVDSMGAAACADPLAEGSIRRYQILTALMLSSQTRDEVTSAAMKRLRQYGCTPESIKKLTQTELADMLYPVGFYARKAEYVKRVADILIEKYGSDIPSTYEELCSLPGVGPKMATLTMNLAWRQNVGVGVDTHVHRIANRLGWTLSATSTPEATEKALATWLPKDLWDEINLLFVGFGQQICTPVNPKCEDCMNQSICPYAMRN